MAKNGAPFIISDKTLLVRQPNYQYPEDEGIAKAAIERQKAEPREALSRHVEALVVEAKLQRRVLLDSHVRRIMRRIKRARDKA
jgi:hypothetical protein